MKNLSIADLYAILNAAANNKAVFKYANTTKLIEAIQIELQNRLGTLIVEVNLKK